MEFVSYDIESNDFRRAGAASRAIKEHLKRIGADAQAIRRTMIAAYEAEMNVVIHSVGGRLEASLTDDRIDVNVVDEGPGIADVELAMTEGYSTAGSDARALGFGAGMGLPNIRRSSDRLRVTSRVGEGTRVSFTVFFRPEVTCAPPAVSLYASADRCRDCRACLAACPTQALRVRDGRPMVLEHLCIDCTECIAACSSGALTVRDVLSSVEDVAAPQETALVVPPALLAGCGAGYRPDQALAALRRLGFADVAAATPFEEAVRAAAMEMAADEGEAVRGDQTASEHSALGPERPIIMPVCPAVVNLVELKFPSLVRSLAPFDSPWGAVGVAGRGGHLACVVSCPGQRSAVDRSEEFPRLACEAKGVECLLPEALGRPMMRELTAPVMATGDSVNFAEAARRGVLTAGADTGEAGEPRQIGMAEDGLLVVSGIRHVMAVLEEIENGLLDDVTTLEAYACEGGCFGSPLLSEDYHVARRRWERGRNVVDVAAARAAGGDGAATERLRPDAGAAPKRAHAARPGVRLDPDMTRAIEKLGRLQALILSLPGRDCGTCGAPTCAALAEDIVMERAAVDLCPYALGDEEEAES